jgi:ferredoxin
VVTHPAVYRIRIDRDDCMSSGKCVADLPEVFGFDDDELAVAAPDGAGADPVAILRVARNCPSQAIHLTGADGTPVDL